MKTEECTTKADDLKEEFKKIRIEKVKIKGFTRPFGHFNKFKALFNVYLHTKLFIFIIFNQFRKAHKKSGN